MKVAMWIAGVVVLVIVIGLIWYAVGSREVIAPTIEELETTTTPAGPQGQGSGEALDDEVETAVLSAVAPYKGSGVATRVFDGTTFTHTVTANIGAPAAGKFYEGWLVMKTSSGMQFFSTGRMEAQHGAYVLTFTASENYPDHNDVVVTEETEAAGLDGKPEAHVLEGAFE